MKIIRDNDGFAIDTWCLALTWHMAFCHQRGCKQRVTTVITDCTMPNGDKVDFALCEEHFQAGNVPGGFQYDLDMSGESQKSAAV